MIRLLFLLFVGLISVRTLYFEPTYQQIPPEKLGIKQANGFCWRKDGTLWMSCERGLLHYNGYTTQIFTHDPKNSNSLLSNSIRGIATNSKNNIWIYYLDKKGLSEFNPDENKFTHHLPDSTKKDAIPNTLFSSIKEDSKGRIWMLTWGAGLARFFPETTTFKTFPLKLQSKNPKECPASRIKSFVELPDGKFLVGFFEAANPDYSSPHIFDAEKETFTPYPFDEALTKCNPMLRQKIEIALKIVNFQYIDQKQNIWLGTYSGLLHYNTTTKEFRRVSGKQISDSDLNIENTRGYVIDEKGFIWINTTNSGVMIVNPETFEATYSKFDPLAPSSLSDNATAGIKKDSYGNIWVLTETGGYSIYSPISQQFQLLSWESMGLEFGDGSRSEIKADQLLVKSHRELLASNKEGITFFDPVTRQILKKITPFGKAIKRNSDEISNRIEDFKFWGDTMALTSFYLPLTYNFSKNNFDLVVAPRGGAYNMHFRHEPRVKRALYSFQWADSLTNVLYELDFKQKKLVPFITLPKGTALTRRFSFLLQDGRWLISGGSKEFVTIDPKTKAYEIYGSKHPDHFFPDSTIRSCHLDPKNQIWFCTENGLYNYDLKTKQAENVNAKIGIKNQEVVSMITDRQGVRWIALPNALIRWDEQHQNVFRFDRESGMISVKFIPSFPQMDDLGNVYMATTSGVLTFNPAKIQIPNTKPIISIASIAIKDDTLDQKEQELFIARNRTLQHSENSLNLDFYSNQIYAPLPHRFSYRIIDEYTSVKNNLWQDNGISNRIRLNNLSSGTYELQVKIKNAFGIESEPMCIRFVVEKPFWLRTWFIAICVLFFALLIYFYIKRRERTLKAQKIELEQKVSERTSEVVEKAKEILQQKEIIEEKNKELTDSIHYAQRIQLSILPDEKELNRNLPNHFVLFQPKDIVSGDFYWSSQQNDSVLWAVVDSTGHGVPGGFMSMLGAGLLNQIVNEEHKLQPDIILNELRTRVILALKQTGADGENRDGMDMSLCRFVPSKKKLQFAGAFNGVYLVRNGELQELYGNKQPIGIYIGEQRPFTMQEIDVLPGDQFYITSDGFTDQFGGPRGKKFKSSNFEKMLLAIYALPMNEQKMHVEKTFNDWKGMLEQLDDVCVFGVKIHLDEENKK
jgi:ligand-binding sensor domain-containing protein/serine phosphatase RsbU (regulator of sigma subunit)